MIVKEYNIFEKGINAIIVTVGLLLCIWTATTMKATVATAIGLIPLLLFLSASKGRLFFYASPLLSTIL